MAATPLVLSSNVLFGEWKAFWPCPNDTSLQAVVTGILSFLNDPTQSPDQFNLYYLGTTDGPIRIRKQAYSRPVMLGQLTGRTAVDHVMEGGMAGCVIQAKEWTHSAKWAGWAWGGTFAERLIARTNPTGDGMPLPGLSPWEPYRLPCVGSRLSSYAATLVLLRNMRCADDPVVANPRKPAMVVARLAATAPDVDLETLFGLEEAVIPVPMTFLPYYLVEGTEYVDFNLRFAEEYQVQNPSLII